MAKAWDLAMEYVSLPLRFPFSLGLAVLFIFGAPLSSLEFSFFLPQALSLSALAVLEFIQDLDLEWYLYVLNFE